MDILKTKTTAELTDSLLAEIAKANNELKCAKRDIDKATTRINFLIVVANEMIDRAKDNR